jgi:hypothetical protein
MLCAALLLAGCTAGDVLRPQVDVGATAAIPSAPAKLAIGTVRQPPAIIPADPLGLSYPTVPGGTFPLQSARPQAALPQFATPQFQAPGGVMLQSPAGQTFAPQAAAPEIPPHDGGSRIIYLPSAGTQAASEQGSSEPGFSQPGFSDAGNDFVGQSDPNLPGPPATGVQQAALAPAMDLGDVEQHQDDPGMLAQLAALPGRMMPGFLKPGASGAEAACRRELKRLGVTFEDISPVGNGGARGCGIANPVRISKLPGGTVVKPAAVLNCRMAVAFAEWVRKDVQPAARTRYLSGVAEIQNMSSYSCRTIGNRRGGRLSEHSFGNAIDVGGVTLKNGKVLKVRKPGFFALRESSLLNKIRADACDRFTTVLGPGYNRDHADHFHLDLMSRNRTSCN